MELALALALVVGLAWPVAAVWVALLIRGPIERAAWEGEQWDEAVRQMKRALVLGFMGGKAR